MDAAEIDPGAMEHAPLRAADKARLLVVARRAIAAAVGADAVPGGRRLDERTSRLGEPGRAFVTITLDGELAGCIGSLAPGLPLEDAVEHAAASAAVGDPRFVPLRSTDLPRAWIHVSVLGSFVPFAGGEAFRLGTDGVLVRRDGRRGLFLPEVATETGWTAEQMLAAVCSKAGLARDAWRMPGTGVETFLTERFGGPALEPAAAEA